MKAITVQQPLAWAIITGRKRIENRTRRSAARGRIAVHSSQRRHPRWRSLLAMLTSRERKSCQESPLGCIIGTVEIVDCVDRSDDPTFSGDVGFVLAKPRRLAKPIPCDGHRGFWTIPDEVERQMGRLGP